MINETTNNSIFKQIKGFFGKAMVIGFFLAAMAVASLAQTKAVFYKGTNTQFGTILIFPSEYRIYHGQGQITLIHAPCTTDSDKSFTCNLTQYSSDDNGYYKRYYGEARFWQDGDFAMRLTQRHPTVIDCFPKDWEYNKSWSFYSIR